MDDHHFGRSRRKGASSGFTLLEVLVSLAIISTVLVSIIRLQGQTISMNETVRFYSLAPYLAQARIAEIRMESESFIGEDNGDFGTDFPNYTWQARVRERGVGSEDDQQELVLDARVIVRHEGWGLVYEASSMISAEQRL